MIRRAPVKITLKLDPVSVDALGGPARTCAPGDHRYDGAQVTLLGLGQPRSLGSLSNLCGTRTVRRFAYQLGDRVFSVADDVRVHAAELPCDARAVFDVLAPGQRRLMREEPR